MAAPQQVQGTEFVNMISSLLKNNESQARSTTSHKRDPLTRAETWQRQQISFTKQSTPAISKSSNLLQFASSLSPSQ
jgi:hypothetical protein